jgi:ABC-type transport system substrate-binding protein
MKKLNSIVILFIAILVVSMSFNRFEWSQKDLNVKEPEGFPKESSPPIPFIVGVGGGPVVIDPIDSWDSDSNDVISQVAETLFWYNVTNPNTPLEPLLAESYSWDVTNTELTVNIKLGVYFHDGTLLDASAVKWNMDRILYFINATGTLEPPTITAFPASIYFHNGVSIMNHTVVVDADTVTIYLNFPFASFLPLLSYTASSIISPTSHSATEYIDITTETLIGTGPFVYDGYVTDTEVNFHAFENYWNGKANIAELIFVVIEEGATRNQAMLSHTIDFLFGADPDLVDIFNADPLTHVEELGPNMVYYYLAWDCYRVPTAWREAMAKAINYDYIIDEIRQGNAVRGPPAVPEGMPGHDPTVVVPQYNVTAARLVMQTIGYGGGLDVGIHNSTGFFPGTDEAAWSAATFFNDEFLHDMDLNYHLGSTFNRDLNDLIFHDLDLIGINPTETTRNWVEFLDDGESGNLRGMWYIGWIPDYIDAFNMLDPLFNPASGSSFINLTDSEIVGWLAAAAVETDIPTRYGIFSDLQHKLFEVLYAHTPLMVTLQRDVHSVDLMDYPYNSIGSRYFYPCIWNPPLPIITIITPSSHAVYGDNAPAFSISIDCLELDSSWYTIDNGITNITFTGTTGTIDQIEWDKKGDGTVTIVFYAIDVLGKIGYSEVLVIKDTTPPAITINSPEAGDKFGTDPPVYNIDVNEANLDTIWYTLDNGTTNITISELNGVIDDDEWNAQPDGYVTIRFYANDAMGREGTAIVIVTKSVPPGIPGANLLVIYFTLFIGIPILIWQRKKKIKH